MAGSLSGANSISRSRIGRPLTSASAPSVARDKRASESFNPSETCTSSGEGPKSIMVPSTSSSNAIDAASNSAKMSVAASFAMVCVAVIRYDVIGALGHHHDVAGHQVFRDRSPVSGFELAAFVNIEKNLTCRNAYVPDFTFKAQAARGQVEILAHGRPIQRHRLDRGGEPT